MKRTTLLAAILFAAFTVPALAHTGTANIDQRQANQQARISQGVNSGALTRREAQNLRNREARIEADKRAARADGRVTRAERRHLQRELNRTSRVIARKKHNGHVAG